MNDQIETAKQELDAMNERVGYVERETRSAKDSLRLARKVVRDAELEKTRVQDEAEALRPKVEDIPADSGLVEAYREAINV